MKKATYEELLSRLPVEELNCYVAEDNRVCYRCGHEMVYAGWKRFGRKSRSSLRRSNGSWSCRMQEGQGYPEDRPHAIAAHVAQLCAGFHGSICHVHEIRHVRVSLPPGNGLKGERRHPEPDDHGELGDILRDELEACL